MQIKNKKSYITQENWFLLWSTYFKKEGVNDIDLSLLNSVIPDIDSWYCLSITPVSGLLSPQVIIKINNIR